MPRYEEIKLRGNKEKGEKPMRGERMQGHKAGYSHFGFVNDICDLNDKERATL